MLDRRCKVKNVLENVLEEGEVNKEEFDAAVPSCGQEKEVC